MAEMLWQHIHEIFIYLFINLFDAFKILNYQTAVYEMHKNS